MSLALVRALFHFLWQGCLVWGLTALALRAFRSPALRCHIACAGLLLCLVLPVSSFLATVRTPAPCTPVRMLPDAAAVQPLRISPAPEPWPQRLEVPLGLERGLHLAAPYVLVLWLAGALLLAARAALGLGWVRRANRVSSPVTDPRWTARLADLAARCGLRRPVQLRILESVRSPFTVGVLRPLILLPASLLSGMSPDLVEALLAHELAHVRRFDYLVNLLQGAVEILLFYHPAVWWISRRIRMEREQACDDLALAMLGESQCHRGHLALALAELDRLQLSTHAAAPAASGGNLMQRIKRLLQPEPRPHGIRILLATLAFSGLCVAMGIAAQGQTPPAVPKAPAAPATPHTKGLRLSYSSITDKDPKFAYGFVRGGGKDAVFMGGMNSTHEIQRLTEAGQDALWFREKGVSYVVKDPGVLTQATELYKPVDTIAVRMEALSQEMEQAGRQTEGIVKEMEAAGRQQEAVGRRMEAAGREAEKLQRELFKAERRRDRAKIADLAKLDADVVVLEAKVKAAEKPMKDLDLEMEKLEAPMKALEARMAEAEKPMQAVEARMKPVETELERAHAAAEKALVALIRAAQAKGLAQRVK